MYRRFERLVNPFARMDNQIIERSLWPFLRSHIRPFRKLLPWMILLGILKASVECGLIFYAGRIVDLMSQATVHEFWHKHKYELSLAVFAVLFIRPFVIWVHHLFLDQAVASNLQEQVRWQAHRHLLGQPMAFFEKEMAGRLSNRVMQLGQAVEEMIYSSFEAIWFGLVYVVVAIVLLTQIDWRLGAPLVLWLAAYICYVRQMAHRVSNASEQWSRARSSASGTIVDAYTNIETVKLFSNSGAEQKHSLLVLQKLRATAQVFRREMTDLSLGMNLLNGAMIVGVVGPAIWLWMQGFATVGQVAAAAALTIRLNGMTGWIMWVASRLFEHAGIIRDGLSTISKPQGLIDRPDAVPLVIKGGAIEFRDVSHDYGQDDSCLYDINLRISEKEKVGLIGHSGAGKSTLMRILLRFVVPDSGRILIDGQPIHLLKQASIREQISVVSQAPSFLHRSVRANLTYGGTDAQEQELQAAAQIAEVHEFIVGLRDSEGRRGYDAHIGDKGVVLSGGQRQRLAIARAVLKNSPILLMDEATSALDIETEARVLANLKKYMRDKTVIMITHRFSSLVELDRIIVLDRGRILEDGSHTQLISRGGYYASLWGGRMNWKDKIQSSIPV